MPEFSEFADVVIVGSGPAGSTYARIIANEWPAARILMLEAGPVVSDPPGHHVSNILDAEKQSAAQMASQGPNRARAYAAITEAEWGERIAGKPDAAMLRRPGLFPVGGGALDGDGFPAGHAASNVGGMGSHWYGACPRPWGDERVPFIDSATMDEALTVGEGLLRASADQFPDSAVARVLEDKLGAMFDAGRAADRVVQPMAMALVRTADGVLRSGPDVILGDLLDDDSGRFELRPDTVVRRVLVEGRRAVGVEIVDATGQVSLIGTGTVVVAADALHTPQLLFASGIRPTALGHYLNEHPQVAIMAELEGVQDAPLSHSVTWVPYLGEAFPYSAMMSQASPAVLPFDVPGADTRKPWLFMSLFGVADPRFENAVSFSETTADWRGLPAISAHYRLSDTDLGRLEKAKTILLEIANRLGRPLPGHAPMVPPLGSSLHYQGTVRMGEQDDGLSVCNRDSRVWGFDNLYVAGNGVIPTRTAGNPTLTAVALGVLGARSIAASH